MCGIVAIIGTQPAAPLLLEGLRRLEYRGYDSAGIATLVNGHIDRRRVEGRVKGLADLLSQRPLPGVVGIAHTRWATHGVPSERNAHPVMTDRVAVVHNGIIENFQELRAEVAANGHIFESETDTEVIAALLTQYLNEQKTPEQAMQMVMDRLRGVFALAVLIAGRHDIVIGARRGTPLAVGYGDSAMYLGSDALSMSALTDRIAYLEDDDWVVLTTSGAQIRDRQHQLVQRPVRKSNVGGVNIGKGNHRHFMEKEILEQPAVIGDTIQTFVTLADRQVHLPDLPVDFAKVSEVNILACGTAVLAGMVSRYWFEKYARLPVGVDVASEFRYREAPLSPQGLSIAISQSGETLDTLMALRYARSQGQKILALVNVPDSTISREADSTLQTIAGPEICVASTKAFTTQLTVLAALAIAAGRARGHLDMAAAASLVQALTEVPSAIAQILEQREPIARIARDVALARDVLFLGRGATYPIALEGALKLKEISYIHAEGYAAGEMKHGPFALVDDKVPVIFVMPNDDLFEKTLSNVQQVAARGGQVIVITDATGADRVRDLAKHIIIVPTVPAFVSPIVYTIPVQLLAYEAALAKGTDIDQPRNLAKSVTVE